MDGPRSFAHHLDTEQYHPRSDAHSNALCRGVLNDLLAHCAPLAEKAARGELVAQLNRTITVNYQRWNIDLVLGPPPGAPEPPEDDAPIRFAVPAVVELAVEAKGVMTEHSKARHNRLRDLQAFHSHAHTYNDDVVAGGVVGVNTAEVFWSPLRDEDDLTRQPNIQRLVDETVDLFRNIPLRDAPSEGPGMEAIGVLAVRHDNLRKNQHPPPEAPAPSPTKLVTGAPAPPTGDPLHYATMVHRLCRAYRARWS